MEELSHSPWLKCHGSIEAHACTLRVRRSRLSPWLKCHGSIEAPDLLLQEKWRLGISPWLKCHGSIEARSKSSSAFSMRELSMAKMPWLH